MPVCQNVTKRVFATFSFRRLRQNAIDLSAVLTGPQLYSSSVFGIGLVASIVLRLMGTPNSARSPWYLQVVDSSVGFILLWAWLLIVTRFLALGKRPMPVLAVVSVLLGATMRGAFVHTVIASHSPESVEPIWYRMSSSLILIGGAILASSYVVHQVAQQLTRIRKLSSTQQVLSSSLQSANKLLDFWFEDLLSSTQTDLKNRWESSKRQLEGVRLSDRLKDYVMMTLRPISQNLGGAVLPISVSAEALTAETLTLRNITQAVTRQGLRHRPLISSVFIAIAAIPTALVIETGQSVVLSLASFILGYTAVLGLLNRVFAALESRLPGTLRVALFILLTFICTIPVAIYSMVLIGFAATRPEYMFQATLLMSLGTTLSVVLIALVSSIGKASTKIADELNDVNEHLRWQLAKVKAQMWQRQQFLARALHGPVQAVFTAYAIRLDISESSNEPKAQRRSLEAEGKSAISETLRNLRGFIASEVDFEKDLNRAIAQWAGICEVELDCSALAKSALSDDAYAARATLDLIQDALSNSVRHGQATSVRLRIADRLSVSDPLVDVRITDNGVGVKTDSQPGFGTQQLDALTTGWTLRNLQPGAELQFSVPVAREPLLG